MKALEVIKSLGELKAQEQLLTKALFDEPTTETFITLTTAKEKFSRI